MKRVIITGLGVVSPNGIGQQAFADAVLAGKSGVRRITSFDPTGLAVQIAGEVPNFDESAWYDPFERKHVSRCVPMAICATAEALADAQLDPTAMSIDEKRQVGVVLGTGGGAQDFSEAQYISWLSGKERQASLYAIPSGTMGTMSSEINMRFGFRGMSQVVTSGCTSSTDAIGYAYRQIQAGVLPMIVTGGVDSPIALGIVKGFILMRIMTSSWNHEPERASRPFTANRDGFVLAEGSWMLVLEELDHARQRGAKVYAEIAGHGSTCEAFHRVRLESPEEPSRAIGLAMKEAGITAADVQYANLHGTSTVLNDRIETQAMKLALNSHAHRVPMSSLKSQIGHPQGACGAAGVAATLVAMQRGQLPPTINLDTPDPECDLDYIPEAGRKAQVEHAICNCIAFGSKNSALILRRLS
jgi:3-oxoacyl-[acyl-carrier-protein] synthase II